VHLLLTDLLACPRCGPEFGLVLRADVLEDRRVLEGSLGCPNCRDHYPVSSGLGDLRPQPRPAPRVTAEPGAEGGASAAEVGGLLGIVRGPGQIILLGSLASRAAALSGMIEEIEVVTATEGVMDEAEIPGVSRILVGGRLPVHSRVIRGVALVEDDSPCSLDEVARVVSPRGRVVVFEASSGTEGLLEAAGLEVLVSDPGRVVAVRA
jgi:uncharacterized protein YbaR (Trm112 family)